MIISVLAYLGLGSLMASLIGLVRPRWLKLRRRRSALMLIVVGTVLGSIGAWWPAGMQRSAQRTVLDEFVPEYQYAEFHETIVRAPRDSVLLAVRQVTAQEIRLFRTLTWIRSPRLPGRRTEEETILTPNPHSSILDVALRSGFVLLGENPGSELVLGTVVCCKPASLEDAKAFRALVAKGYVRAAMNFLVEYADEGMTRLSTETRVIASGDRARRAFGLYWSIIYPGSSLIRRSWLQAIRRRAE